MGPDRAIVVGDVEPDNMRIAGNGFDTRNGQQILPQKVSSVLREGGAVCC